MTKYWIVWNKERTEGFVTDDEMDANVAAGSIHPEESPAPSTLAVAFHENDEDHLDRLVTEHEWDLEAVK